VLSTTSSALGPAHGSFDAARGAHARACWNVLSPASRSSAWMAGANCVVASMGLKALSKQVRDSRAGRGKTKIDNIVRAGALARDVGRRENSGGVAHHS
jgi:hypothetical protein